MALMVLMMRVLNGDDRDQGAGGRENIKVSPRHRPLELATLLPLYF